MKNNFVIIFLLVLLIIISSAFAYYYGTQKSQSNPSLSSPTITPSPTESELISPSPSLPPTTPTSNLPVGWQTYTNSTFAFQISYPSSYQALTDSNNLYGWPQAVVLIYNGGQSYDLAIEHWATQSEYENKYPQQNNLTVKKVNNSYITLLNTNADPEVDQIIATFQPLAN